MAKPQKSNLNLDFVEEELQKSLALMKADQKEVENEPSTAFDLEVCLQSKEISHQIMADTFMSYNVNEKQRETQKLIKKFKDAQKREEKFKRNQEEKDNKLLIVESIYELFEGSVDKALINDVGKKHNYDPNLMIEELALASTVCVRIDVSPSYVVAKTVHATNENVFNQPPKNSPPPSPQQEYGPETSEEEVIHFAESYANKLQHNSKHHYQSAHRHGVNDPRCGALTAIAREEQQKANKEIEKVDRLKAKQIRDSLDLHNMTIAQGLRMVNYSIENIRKVRPTQRELLVIVGRGNNSIRNKAFMKEAVVSFLNKMKIKFNEEQYNPGALIVKL